MVYSQETATLLANVAKGSDITVADVEKLIALDAAATGHTDLSGIYTWFRDHPEQMAGRIDDYNAKNALVPIVPGKARKTQYVIIGVVVVIVVVLAVMFGPKALKLIKQRF